MGFTSRKVEEDQACKNRQRQNRLMKGDELGILHGDVDRYDFIIANNGGGFKLVESEGSRKKTSEKERRRAIEGLGVGLEDRPGMNAWVVSEEL